MGNDVSSLTNVDIVKNLTRSVKPKSFGEQLLNKEKEKLIHSSLGKIKELKNEIQNNILRLFDLEIYHQQILQTLQYQTKNPPNKPLLSIEEFQESLLIENTNYQEEKIKLQEERLSIQQKLQDILNDPYNKIKNNYNIIKQKIKLKRKRNKNKENNEKKQLNLKVLKTVVNGISPKISLYGIKLLFNITTNNKKLQDLIDNTNDIISSAFTKQDIDNARVIRNSTLSILNDNERKLDSLFRLIKIVNRIITILNSILSILILLFTIPKPFGLGPIMPTPIAQKVKKIQDIIISLNIILSIFQGILETKLNDLRDLKHQLQNINDLLDNVVIDTLSDIDLQNFINNINNDSLNKFEDYKGFKLIIKEEETLGAQQAIVVRGSIKRKYAVAINKDGVGVLKSELSFTLDPQDLIEQLKIIIDQQNLQS